MTGLSLSGEQVRAATSRDARLFIELTRARERLRSPQDGTVCSDSRQPLTGHEAWSERVSRERRPRNYPPELDQDGVPLRSAGHTRFRQSTT